jgi:hypothetical protein
VENKKHASRQDAKKSKKHNLGALPCVKRFKAFSPKVLRFYPAKPEYSWFPLRLGVFGCRAALPAD